MSYYARDTFTPGVAEDEFLVSFPYDDSSELLVTVDGSPVSWTETSEGRITLASPTTGTVVITRSTPIDGLDQSLDTNATTILADQLTDQHNQFLRSIQELWDSLARAQLVAGNLPTVTGGDEGDILRVVGGSWQLVEPGGLLYTATGGSEPRELVDHLGEELSVLDFGATGDGVTDDTAAIQAAIDSYYGVIRFPPGNYLISDTITLRPSQRLIGSGPCLDDATRSNTRIIAKSTGVGDGKWASGKPMFEYPSTGDYWHWGSIENMRIDGDHYAAIGVYIYRSGENSFLRDLYVMDCEESGIHLEGTQASMYLEHISLFDNGEYGLNINNGGFNVAALGLSGDRNGTALVRMNGDLSLSLTIEGLKAESDNAAKHQPVFLMDGCDGSSLTVVGGWVENSAGADDLIQIINTPGTNYPCVQLVGLSCYGYTNLIHDGATLVPVVGNKRGVVTYNASINSHGTVPVPRTNDGLINVRDYGAVGDGVTDDTTAIQAALTAARDSTSIGEGDSSWSIKEALKVVYVPPGDYLITNTLVISEGVMVVGASQTASRFRHRFTSSNIGWRAENDNFVTYTKNFGWRNVAFLPDYATTYSGSAVYFIHLKYCIEPFFRDCRFVMHKGAVAGGQLNGYAVRLQKCRHVDMQGCVFDGGRYGVLADDDYTDTEGKWGADESRFVNNFFYNARHAGLRLDGASNKNLVIGNRVERPVNQEAPSPDSGFGYGVSLVDSNDNNIAGNVFDGAHLKYAVLCEGTSSRNLIHGNTIRNALTFAAHVAANADSNQVVNNLFSDLVPTSKRVQDLGTNTRVITDLQETNRGSSSLVCSAVTLTDVDTWYTVATATLAESSSMYLRVTLAGTLEGVGRRLVKAGYFLDRASGAASVTAIAAEAYSSASGIEVQVVADGETGRAIVQARRVSGSASAVSPLVVAEWAGNTTGLSLRDGTVS